MRLDSIGFGDNDSAQFQKLNYDIAHNVPMMYEAIRKPDMLKGNIENLRRRLEVISLLTHEISSSAREETDRKRFSDDLDHCLETNHEAVKLIQAESIYQRNVYDQDSLKKEMDLLLCVTSVTRSVDVLEKTVKDEVRKEKEHFAQLSKSAGWWSVAFYTLGWSLGLLGKLSGDDEIVEVAD